MTSSQNIRICYLRLEQQMPLKQIGASFDLSRQRVQQIVDMNKDYYKTESTIGERNNSGLAKTPNTSDYPLTVSLRFWAMVEVLGKDDCWPWMGGRDFKGFGRFRYNGDIVRSDIMAQYLSRGPTNAGLYHKCGRPECCNFHHLLPV